MRSLDFSRYVLGSYAIAAMLAGCGGSQPPVGTYGEPSSAMVGKDQSLLYISDPQAGDVYMVALPSGRFVGKLTGNLLCNRRLYRPA
jgi:hypothetical protein